MPFFANDLGLAAMLYWLWALGRQWLRRFGEVFSKRREASLEAPVKRPFSDGLQDFPNNGPMRWCVFEYVRQKSFFMSI